MLVRLCFFSFVLLIAVLPFPVPVESAPAKMQSTMAVNGASISIPSECKPTPWPYAVDPNLNAICEIDHADGSFVTIGLHSDFFPSFSNMMKDIMGKPQRGYDIDIVLKGLLRAAQEDYSPTHHLDKFTHRRLSSWQLPRGAEGCQLVTKQEGYRARDGGHASIEKRELSCATRLGTDTVLAVVAIYAFTYSKPMAQSVPPTFDKDARQIFNSLQLIR